jgi:hypothetical protein
MKTVPPHVVPAAIPDGFAETVTVVSVAPAVNAPVGEMVSQLLLAQLCSVTWAVVLVSNTAVTMSVCAAGAAPPATAVNVRAAGLTVKTDAGTLITSKVMGTVSVLAAELMESVALHLVPTLIPD